MTPHSSGIMCHVSCVMHVCRLPLTRALTNLGFGDILNLSNITISMAEEQTPVLQQHIRLQAKMAPFGGWLMPIQYPGGILDEYAWCRSQASLFDICHMGEFLVSGDALASGFSSSVTPDVAAMRLNTCRYGFLLDEKGGILDDLVVYRLTEDSWMVVVNAATSDADAAQMRSRLRPGTSFEDISSHTGKLDLQGPRSYDVLCGLAGGKLAALPYYGFDSFVLLGEKCIISRTGYTGELGYEIYASVDTTRKLWDTLMENPLVKPAGLGARDVLRLEMGYVLYGQDISVDTTPIDAGLGQFIAWEKNFIGKEALLKQKSGGSRKYPVFLMSTSRRAPRHNHQILFNNSPVGSVTSGSFSPALGCGIAMGYAQESLAIGTQVTTNDVSARIEAVVGEKPFYRKGSARMHIADGCIRP
jgi:aminomethyltransferase